jgi:dTDP-4-amino-4,6-dideoxygalactose transaminase
MIHPVLAAGCTPIFYPVEADFSVAVQALDCRRSERTRFLLISHFFALVHDLGAIKAWCDRHAITLIEDCAHAFYRNGTDAPGTQGHYAIASAVKFLGGHHGAMLAANPGHALPPPPDPLPLRQEAREAVRELQSRLRRRAALPPCTALPPLSAREQMASVPLDRHRLDTLAEPETGWSASRLHQRRYRQLDHASIRSRRTHNFSRLQQAFQPLLHRMDPELPASLYPKMQTSAPYVFPLLVPESHPLAYLQLKQLGVPVWRWDTLVHTDCPQANRLRLRLIQLPCHQQLTEPELAWLIATLQHVLSA